MQYFDRNSLPPPATFHEDGARAERQALLQFWRLGAERQSQSKGPQRHFEPDMRVLTALEKLFEGKCAFCESRCSLNFHLFRPPEEAQPFARSEFAHLYYVWLRTDWRNHYAICEPCSQASHRRFPVRGGRRGELPSVDDIESFASENNGIWHFGLDDSPLLLDPCKSRDYSKDISVDSGGYLLALSERGGATIETFDLNREALLKDRSIAYRQYLALFWEEIDSGSSYSAINFRQLEFGGTWFLLLRRFLSEIAKKLERPISLNKARLGAAFTDIMRTPIGRVAFDEAFTAIAQPEKLERISRTLTRLGKDEMPSLIEISNFKALEKISLAIPAAIAADDATQRPAEAAALIILGENAAGKSSLLEAVALTLCGDTIRINLDKSSDKLILDPALMGAPGADSLKAASVKLTFAGENALELVIDRQRQIERGDVIAPKVFAYGAFRQYDKVMRRSRKFGHVGTLFRPDIILPNPEKWLLGLDDAGFALVVRALRDILSLEGEFEVVERDIPNERCLLVSKIGDHGELMRSPFDVASSGYRSVLAMVCDIIEGMIGGKSAKLVPLDSVAAVILIDEIEAHLHPRWKMQIMTSLRRVFPKAIFIATTHDPLCLRGMHDGEIIVFNRAPSAGEDFSMPIMVETLNEFPDIENLTVEQLLTSDLFEMFSTDSPAAERRLAALGDLVARRNGGEPLTDEDNAILDTVQRDVNEAMPLGTSETQRLVLGAVAEFLEKRREESVKNLNELREEARNRIIQVLERN